MSSIISRYPLITKSIEAVLKFENKPFEIKKGDLFLQLFEYTNDLISKNIPELKFDKKDSKEDSNDKYLNIFYKTDKSSDFIYFNYGIFLNELVFYFNKILDDESDPLKLEIFNCKTCEESNFNIVLSFTNIKNINCDIIIMLSNNTENFKRIIQKHEDDSSSEEESEEESSSDDEDEESLHTSDAESEKSNKEHLDSEPDSEPESEESETESATSESDSDNSESSDN